MKYAVIKLQGSQFRVSEGDEILVGKLSTEPAPEILLYVDGSVVKLGNPLVEGAKVKTKVLKDVEKGEKVTVSKYKAKSRYRKKVGFRPKYSRVEIVKISV